jgi:hypothetical protein
MMPATHAQVIHLYGVFMVAWSVLEGVIQTAIMKELQISPQKAIIVTAGMQFRQRVAVLCSLLKLSSPDRDAAVALLRKIEKKGKRNMLVHGHIIVGVPGQLTFVKSSASEDTGLRTNKASFTAAELKRHILELKQESENLQTLLQVSDADIQQLVDTSLAEATRSAP